MWGCKWRGVQGGGNAEGKETKRLERGGHRGELGTARCQCCSPALPSALGNSQLFGAPAAIPGCWVAVLHSPQTLVRSKSCLAAPTAWSRAALPCAADHCGVISGAVPGFCTPQGFCTLEHLSLRAVHFCISHPFKNTLEIQRLLMLPCKSPLCKSHLAVAFPRFSPLDSAPHRPGPCCPNAAGSALPAELPWDQPSDSCQEYSDWKERKTYLPPWRKIDSAPLGRQPAGSGAQHPVPCSILLFLPRFPQLCCTRS